MFRHVAMPVEMLGNTVFVAEDEEAIRQVRRLNMNRTWFEVLGAPTRTASLAQTTSSLNRAD